ncbi:hypothetical protein QR98_0053740 [Sarcoptes scabiei]|nr:hypothetical protein QR98_0053740 [Sarcoptes scabiei]
MESVSNKYIETVSIKNFEDFYRTLFQWLEHSCSLVALRKDLRNVLRLLSTETSILHDPESLREQIGFVLNSWKFQ